MRFPGKSKNEPTGRLGELRRETVGLVIDYVKQETLGPLRGLGRVLALGIAGSIAVGIGAVLLLLALLRFLQGETGQHLSGHLSWIPYLAVVGVALLVAALTVWRIVSGPAARRLPAREESDST